jgi:hypothetical protein
MEDVSIPPGYEARVFVGVDPDENRYIAHWMDNFGAAYSIPHAVGGAQGDTIVLTFAYDAGPFRDTFSYDRKADRWHFLLESSDSAGVWKRFAEYEVKRR